jgi:hypothetical protein
MSDDGTAGVERLDAADLSSRRRFLSAAGLGAAGLVGAGALRPTGGARSTGQRPVSGRSGVLEDRRQEALQVRVDDAERELAHPFPERVSNGDEDEFPGLANFTKALPHDDLGEVDPDAYQTLLRALESGQPEDFEAIPMGGAAKLADPQGAFAFTPEGPDPWSRVLEPPPRMASEAFAGEMVECYWLALAREVPYSRYGDEPVTAAAIAGLARFDDYREVDAATLFRSAELPGVNTGPYVSQFLLQPYTMGSTLIDQRYTTTIAGDDHLTDYADWLAVQNGGTGSTQARFDPLPRYIRNGRDLGEWSHRDFSYQGPLVAALILLRYGPDAVAPDHPDRSSTTTFGVVSSGAPDVLDHVARSALAAMKAAWYNKWLIHRRLRPEESAGRIHNHLTGAAAYPLHPTLTDAAVLDVLYSRYGSYLCPQAYPEGCPTHPAYPGATAAIGGAGITVLKQRFNTDFEIPDPVVPADDGLSLKPWTGEPLTVGGELNKLAFNMAFGRDTAGVHFRRDEVRGILL